MKLASSVAMTALLPLVLLLSVQAEDVSALVRRGTELSREGKDLDALRALRKAAEIAPENSETWFQIAVLLDRNGRTVESLAAFERAASLSAERTIQQSFGEALYRAGRAKDAIPPLERAAASPAPVADALPFLAGAYQATGRSEDAFATLARYLEMRPDDGDVRLLLGRELAAAKRYAEALDVWKTGLAFGARSAEMAFSMGETLGRRRETYVEAETYLRKALEADPRHLRARFLLGRVLARGGKAEDGLKELVRAAEDYPDSPDVQFALAAVYQQLGRDDEAERARGLFRE